MGGLVGKPGGDGFAVWKVKGRGPFEKCVLKTYSAIPGKEGCGLLYSISLDKGEKWIEMGRRVALPAWGGDSVDITDRVKGKEEFLLKITFKKGGERLVSVALDTVPE